MSQQQEKTSEQGEKKSFRPAQVVATALAAVTAALLGSTLGVAGTVVGAGVASVITTVGAELYLRSLQRTREAAVKARAVLATAGQRRGGKQGLSPVEDPAQMPTVLLPLDPSEMPTVRISKLTAPAEPEESFGDKLRKLRWPIIIGTSVVATAVAIAVAVGAELAGVVQPGFVRDDPGTSQHQEQDKNTNPPATSENTAPPSETESNTPPPSSSSSSTPTSESPTPDSSASDTPPPSSTGGAASTTPSAPQSKGAPSGTPNP
ncbi:hypothetical protein VSH64_32795 [Amycolatopsis rhabdoformis]|uniref:Uncharacterized protein n=1 Tax=Amycolatopsis rhabdoformis TaxID=1448059 RepID=A0ABZ1I130_9PSEU|nr:hypothetical protein [Amycolatopsis rhabdoformis]WSE27606.1 hypothetical protein VSH64_32795 [Amycolatopsis rhabdoformis]